MVTALHDRQDREQIREGGALVNRRGAAGYSLVVLIMAVTVLNIMLAAALPKWSGMIQRDKEEELISRGWQYAEAIRVFQRRFQRYPLKLEELIKVKPRCIRQLWKDPMTASGEWTLIFQGQGTPIVPPPGTPPPPSQGLDPNQPQISVGPIIGVRSRSTRESKLIFFGQERYDEWQFRADMLVRPQVDPRVPSRGLAGSTRWLGRPMPSFIPPGGMPPSGLPGGPGGPGGLGKPGSSPFPPGGRSGRP